MKILLRRRKGLSGVPNMACRSHSPNSVPAKVGNKSFEALHPATGLDNGNETRMIVCTRGWLLTKRIIAPSRLHPHPIVGETTANKSII